MRAISRICLTFVRSAGNEDARLPLPVNPAQDLQSIAKLGAGRIEKHSRRRRMTATMTPTAQLQTVRTPPEPAAAAQTSVTAEAELSWEERGHRGDEVGFLIWVAGYAAMACLAFYDGLGTLFGP
jgi:hypothetical protein